MHEYLETIGPVTASGLFKQPTPGTLFLASEVFAVDPTAFTHAPEDASLVVKVGWCVQLGNSSLVHNADAVVVNNRFEPMSDAEESLRC